MIEPHRIALFYRLHTGVAGTLELRDQLEQPDLTLGLLFNAVAPDTAVRVARNMKKVLGGPR